MSSKFVTPFRGWVVKLIAVHLVEIMLVQSALHGILLYSEEKQQDFFGCLARFLGCPGLREADNPEI